MQTNQSRRSAKCTRGYGVTGSDEKGGKGGDEEEGGRLVHRKDGGEERNARVKRHGKKGTLEERQPGRIRQLVERVKRKMEDENLEKYKVKENKKGAYKGRGAPLEWRTVQS